MKGITSLELVIASSIYIVGVFFLLQIISSGLASYEKESERETGRNIAEDVSKVLFESEGIPENWDEDPAGAKQLGLCKESTGICIISEDKLNSLDSLDPDRAKELLNLRNYDFRVLIRDVDNNLVFDYNSSEIQKFAGIFHKECLNETLDRIKSVVEVWE
jgi:hypothetical protein